MVLYLSFSCTVSTIEKKVDNESSIGFVTIVKTPQLYQSPYVYDFKTVIILAPTRRHVYKMAGMPLMMISSIDIWLDEGTRTEAR